jgi:hypothetical protein
VFRAIDVEIVMFAYRTEKSMKSTDGMSDGVARAKVAGVLGKTILVPHRINLILHWRRAGQCAIVSLG